MNKTRIIKTVDKSKCPHCESEDIVYFEKEDFFWCIRCKRAYQYEENEHDINETEEEEYAEWSLVEEEE